MNLIIGSIQFNLLISVKKICYYTIVHRINVAISRLASTYIKLQ